jgi:E3 SUMO-protein ligase PIAS1
MVFCAADSGLNQFSKSDIAFPYQVELKANLDDVKANLRGLKNRPGSTRPADITSYIRKRAGYTNLVAMTFALTQKVCLSCTSGVKARLQMIEILCCRQSRETTPC